VSSFVNLVVKKIFNIQHSIIKSLSPASIMPNASLSSRRGIEGEAKLDSGCWILDTS
jgi:hypothetical protein